VKADLTLPDEKSEPKKHLEEYVTLIFGEKKIGKTTLTSHFGDTLHLMTEPGDKALSIYSRPINSWEEFRGYLKLLRKDKRFRSVTLDTIDLLYRQCVLFICAKLGIDHPQDEGYGKGYDMVRAEFGLRMSELCNIGKGVFLVSHVAEKDIKSRSGGSYTRIVPSMPNMARDVVEGMVDIWGYYHFVGDRRWLQIRGDEFIACGTRCEKNFMNADGSPIVKIPMGGSSREAHDNFVAAFNNKMKGGTEKKSVSLKVKRNR
jgi:hypothetical protein